MSVSIVVAMDRNGVIGNQGGLPWHLPSDLKRFREITMGKPLVMGRRTHESIGRPLPGRRNIVVSRQPTYVAPGCDMAQSFAAALKLAQDAPEVMVIGGASLYAAALVLADRIYLTEVDAEVAGDVYFPPYTRADWREARREPSTKGERDVYGYSFVILERAL